MKRIVFATTLAMLSAISLSAQSTLVTKDSPKVVVDEFAKMEINGELLTPDGRHKANLLFAHATPLLSEKRITVIGNAYSLREIWESGNHARVLVTYKALGDVDSASHYTPPAALSGKMVVRYDLILTRQGGGGESTQNARRTGQWRIENPQRTILVGLNAAIAQLTATQGKAADPVIKRNASITLMELRKFQP